MAQSLLSKIKVEERKLKKAEERVSRIEDEISALWGQTPFVCSCCNKSFPINSLHAIKTHWYDRYDGRHEGEWQIVCPESGIRNRLLFDIPYEHRKNPKKNPETQFKLRFEKIFKSSESINDDKLTVAWVNSYYINGHREQFGLVAKPVREE